MWVVRVVVRPERRVAQYVQRARAPGLEQARTHEEVGGDVDEHHSVAHVVGRSVDGRNASRRLRSGAVGRRPPTTPRGKRAGLPRIQAVVLRLRRQCPTSAGIHRRHPSPPRLHRNLPPRSRTSPPPHQRQPSSGWDRTPPPIFPSTTAQTSSRSPRCHRWLTSSRPRLQHRSRSTNP